MRIDPVPRLISDVQTMLEQMNWPGPYQVAQALGLKIVSGPIAGINLEPPPMIHLPDQLIGFRRSHTLAHETPFRGWDSGPG